MRSSLRILQKSLVVLLIILTSGFYIHYAVQNFAAIPRLHWGLTVIVTALFTVIFVIVGIGIAGQIWRLLLSDHGFSPSWQQVQVIFAITQFGKYVPGNVGQFLGRVFMAREIGIPVSVTANTMLIEIIWGAGMGGGLALLSMVFFVEEQALGFGMVKLGLTVVILMFLPWLGINFVNRFIPKIAKRLSGGYVISSPRLITALVVALLFLLNFWIMGVILKLQALWFFDVTAGSVIELTCLFAIAWLAGYLVPGAPGGLGVREAMMVMLLSPVLGPGTAVGLSLTLRLTTTVGDAVAFGLGILGRKYVT
jgi:glycosyltransferase 2 family protein